MSNSPTTKSIEPIATTISASIEFTCVLATARVENWHEDDIDSLKIRFDKRKEAENTCPFGENS